MTSAPRQLTLARARQVAESVADPELPMLTLADLGVLRDVTVQGDHVIVSLTPTYSGCPAMHEMRRDMTARLAAAGFAAVEVRTLLSPPWSSDLISAEGRGKLAAAGIAPPRSRSGPSPGPVQLTLFATGPPVACPVCGSSDTQRIAAFSGTACKDLHRCRACGEPFEHVKEI
ncbi:MAG TPA: 1,2-phenylacetyl-CoA epoxidase subunit PaaD [Streptosporangiaceae bacterium]|nr:1,2-phenylacetyl-CoA epoxidase subunit PaaD [Streptosporangiaceae bacterium]